MVNNPSRKGWGILKDTGANADGRVEVQLELTTASPPPKIVHLTLIQEA
jgi:hypothetical protein